MESPATGARKAYDFPDVGNGIEVRARSTVCHIEPGHGMGLKFVHVAAEYRSRLNQFIKVLLECAEKEAHAAEKGL
jgi:hypothetical protein